MAVPSERKNDEFARKFRDFFTARDVILHEGGKLRRFSVGGRSQALFATAATLTVLFSGYGMSQAMAGAIAYTAPVAGSPEAQVAAMRAEVSRMRAEVAAAKEAAKLQAAKIEQRQAVLNAVVSGKADRSVLEADLAATPKQTSALTDEIVAPLRKVEARQVALAAQAQKVGEARVRQAAAHIQHLGLAPGRFVKVNVAMGGPYEAVSDEDAAAATTADADAQFRSLFETWKKLDSIESSTISIPSRITACARTRSAAPRRCTPASTSPARWAPRSTRPRTASSRTPVVRAAMATSSRSTMVAAWKRATATSRRSWWRTTPAFAAARSSG
jgi:hypothetical protein